MPARRRPRRKDAQLAFEALSIEGGLLSADWLARAAQLSAGGQAEADYRVPKGLNLRDEIGRYWRIAQAHWSEFAAGRKGGGDPRALAERFVYGLLREGFGFASLAMVPSVEIEERTYPVGALALGKRVPIVVAPAGGGLDTLSPAFGDGVRRRSAFGLAQEYLNASDDALWGLVSDGVTLRIVRDNASLTRPAWIEADLSSLFTEERYADFAALWLLAHETRFGAAERPPTDCALETWRAAGREEGTRAREHLRRGVEDALVALGQGFLSHPENQALRGALESGALTRDALFQQLLRLVYRLIFLLTVEERGVLHDPAATEGARTLYAHGYSVRRLRDRSVRRSGYDRFGDLWAGLKIVLRGMAHGEARLGLPALGGLFAEAQCSDLDRARLENRALLSAIFRLSWLRDDGALARVNWRDMGPEELGSVYESLLELVPVITQGGRAFSFATGAETKGNARKTTGSYYTPDSLVQVLLDRALEPIVATTIAEHPERTVEALLALSIVDPACGSGHFLLSAARRLAAHVARIEADGTPSTAQYRHAVRRVVGRCIFGVDLNPMAVDLCKVSLWMEAVEPGRPLSFLNSHVQQGNALLGAMPELLAAGIPDAAWEPIEGDDKKVASALKKQNQSDATSISLDFMQAPASTYLRLGAGARAVDDAADDNLPAVESKEHQWSALVVSAAYDHQRFVADLWCAAFVWKKEPGSLRDIAPTDAVFRAVQQDGASAALALRQEVSRLRSQYDFFHWHLAFPQVFARGGFNLVLGNPPWDQIQLDAREWFAASAPDVANAQHHAARKRALQSLNESSPPLYRAFLAAQRRNEGVQAFLHTSGRYPRTSNGRLNTAPLFAEASSALAAGSGLSAMVVPTGIVTDSFTREFFQYLVESGRLHGLLSFVNEDRLFVGVDHRVNFCLLIVGGANRTTDAVTATFFARQTADLSDPERIVRLTPEDFRLFNPNTGTCPTFFCKRDAELNRAIYRRAEGVFVRDGDSDGNPWGFRGLLMFMMNTDSALFRTRKELEATGHRLDGNRFIARDGSGFMPLYEAKMISQFNHRFGDFALLPAGEREHILPQAPDGMLATADYVTMPRYWVPESVVQERLVGVWEKGWLLGWRDVTDTRSSVRTVIASFAPRSAVGHGMPLMLTDLGAPLVASLCANLCSFVLDYAARQKIGGTHLTYGYLKQLPLLRPSTYDAPTPWARERALREWILPRVLELVFTAWDLEPFARDCGYGGPPFRWISERRFLLRCELDAAFFQIYGLARDDVNYVMDTFPIVRKNDEKAYRVYRTKRVILEIYDAMTGAARSATPYLTRLDPPPADARMAHPPRGRAVLPLRPTTPTELRHAPPVVWGTGVVAEAATRSNVGHEAGAWATMLTGENLGTTALAAILRALPEPRAREEVERAVVLTLLPRLMLPNFDEPGAKQWRSLIGNKDIGITSVSELAIPWLTVIKKAMGQALLVVDAEGRWSAGAEVTRAPSDIFDARALVALAWLATVTQEDAEVTKQVVELRHVA